MIYLASPYSDPDPSVRQQRFDAVCHAAGRLMAGGAHVFSPICHGHPIAARADLPTSWEYWEAYCRKMIAACDVLAVLKLPGWEQSTGVAAEIAIAREMGKPVEYVEPEGTS